MKSLTNKMGWKKKLIKKYKWLTPECGRYPISMFGIECGWQKLIEKLCKDIDNIVKSDKLNDFEVHQIKEKWGLSRVYVAGSNGEIDKLIDKAEDDSAHTCETCGKKGKLYIVNGWYLTVCSKHLESYKKHILKTFGEKKITVKEVNLE